ncbi:MAG: hypothetical protein KKF62_19670 [Bacteroidetes bacterium]|nr:hypothetical protein [Bacteroidota bacterium]
MAKESKLKTMYLAKSMRRATDEYMAGWERTFGTPDSLKKELKEQKTRKHGKMYKKFVI